MEAILDNLCKIKDMRVVSRNSMEQYRNNPNLEMYNEALSMLKIQITLMRDNNISDEIGLLGYKWAYGAKRKSS